MGQQKNVNNVKSGYVQQCGVQYSCEPKTPTYMYE